MVITGRAHCYTSCIYFAHPSYNSSNPLDWVESFYIGRPLFALLYIAHALLLDKNVVYFISFINNTYLLRMVYSCIAHHTHQMLIATDVLPRKLDNFKNKSLSLVQKKIIRIMKFVQTIHRTCKIIIQ